MKEINIAEILQNFSKGTSLYSPICGTCYLNSTQHHNEAYPIEVTTSNNDYYYFNPYGKYKYSNKNEGEILLFPSKDMKDWSKLQFKKGDVLVNTNGNSQVIFDSYANNSYSLFRGKHYLNCTDGNNHIYLEESFFITENYTLESKDAAQCYINTIEERLGSKLNLQTLEAEPVHVFKPFDKVLVRNFPEAPWRISFFEAESKNTSLYTYVCINDSYIYCIPYEGNEHLLGTTND